MISIEFPQIKEKFPKNLLLMWHFLHYLPKVTDGSYILDKRERKN